MDRLSRARGTICLCSRWPGFSFLAELGLRGSIIFRAVLGGERTAVKNLLPDARDIRDVGSIQVGKIPWRRAWHPTPVFFPGESRGFWNMAGYSPWCCKET